MELLRSTEILHWSGINGELESEMEILKVETKILRYANVELTS